MAPQLDLARRDLIKVMLQKNFDTKLIASNASCSTRAVQRIRQEEEQPKGARQNTNLGRRSCLTQPMQKALLDKLTEHPYLYHFEMSDYLHKKFGKRVSERSIARALRARGWTRTVIHRIAQQRDADLRDHYLHRISKYKSYQLVFIDESGCDRRVGYRHWGWSPKGTSPVEVTKFGRGRRWHILPAYTQDGIILRRVYQGSTDSDLFEDFIAQLLHHCGRYPEPKSVLVMDNASWHHTEKLQQMCQQAGVHLEYLSPYSPDFNPIEEYFGDVKRFIKKTAYKNEAFVNRAFDQYLEWCADVVGYDEQAAENHFRHAGIPITYPPEQTVAS